MQANIFSKNLRGLSLKDENLKGINLSKENIRGLDFTEADLTGAILDGATCGVETWWTIPVLIISLFIMSLSGFSASIIVSCNLYYFSRIHGVIKNIFTNLISVIYITWLHAYFLKNLPKYLRNIGLIKKEDVIDQSALIFLGIIIIIIVGILIPFIINMDESNDKDVHVYYVVISISVFVILVNLLLLAYFGEPKYDITRRAVGAFIGSILGILISNQAILQKKKKYVWIWNLFVYLISAKGTKFHGSTLDDASFANVDIKGSSFINCTLNRTSWEGVKRIDCSRIQGNYLDDPKIRDLVIKKITGKVKDYRDMNLQGLNLFGANLEKIDLSGTDLSNSQLTKAKLKDSTLSQTRLDNVDLRNADITGTTIEMRSISATAKLDGLICDYFYPQSNPTQRYPITGNLTSQEAIKLLQKPSEINIIFKKDGIDWQAFLQVFENLLKELKISSDNSEKLIRGFKRELNGDFVIRLNVPDNVDEVEFKDKIIQAYDKHIEYLRREYRDTLRQTDIDFQENTSMLKITRQLAHPESPIIQNIITIGNNGGIDMTNNSSELSVGGSVGGNLSNLHGDNSSAIQADNNQGVVGNNNQATQENKLGADAGTSLTKEDVVKFLAELEDLVKTTELPIETKEEVIEDLSSAKKAIDKEEPNKNLALRRLENVVHTLEKTSKGVDAGQQIWTTAKPIIVKVAAWLGAAAGSHLLGL